MNANRSKRILFTVAAGGLLFSALCLLLNWAPRAARADPGFLFVSPTGSGSSCSQSAPCDLQTALSEAWMGDTVFVAGGRYTGSGGAVITLTQSIELRGGWDGAPSGPVVRDPGVYYSILDGEDQRRVVYVKGGITPVLDGFVVARGNASQGLEPGKGGGIYSSASSPILTNNTIKNNVAYSGTAPDTGWGGGVYLGSASESALIAGNTFVSNTANPLGSGLGGGLVSYYSAVTIRGNAFLHNVAGSRSNSHGGGLYLEESPATVSHNLLRGNKGTPAGEGFGGGSYSQRGDVTFNGNTVLSNTAQYGAVVFNGNSRITVTNNVVAENLGGVFVRANASFPLVGELAHNTIAQNVSEGVYVGYYSSGYASLTLTNNIIVSHTTGIYAHADPTNGVIATHTLFRGNDADTDGDAVASTDEIVGMDPRFVDPDGPDYHLQEESPAIDAGTSVPWLRVDIDGDARPADGGYDIGADEFVLRRVYLPLVVRSASP